MNYRPYRQAGFSLPHRVHIIRRLLGRRAILADPDAEKSVQPEVGGMVGHQTGRDPNL